MRGFNPRSPCGERRLDVLQSAHEVAFQPTLPLRGATRSRACSTASTGGFNPRSPCGERRRGREKECPAGGGFNPRSPCGERRPPCGTMPRIGIGFNPRSPCGERRAPAPPLLWRTSFNPRSPCGERPRSRDVAASAVTFQPTLPLRGATFRLFLSGRQFQVSTHAPLAGSDTQPSGADLPISGFQPTLPLRGATIRGL